MANSNQTLKWINSLEDNKIIFDAGIIDGSKNRGIYGILRLILLKELNIVRMLEEQLIFIQDF